MKAQGSDEETLTDKRARDKSRCLTALSHASPGKIGARPAWDESTAIVPEKKHVFRPQPLKAKSKSLLRKLVLATPRSLAERV